MAERLIRVQIDGISGDAIGAQNTNNLGTDVGQSIALGNSSNSLPGVNNSQDLSLYQGLRGGSGEARKFERQLASQRFKLNTIRRTPDGKRVGKSQVGGIGSRAKNIAKSSGTYLANVSASAGFATATVISTAVINHMDDSASLRGAGHRADQLNNVSAGIGAVAGVATAFALGGPIGGAIALAGMAYKGYLENRKLLRERRVEEIRSSYYRTRLRKSITERRY